MTLGRLRFTAVVGRKIKRVMSREWKVYAKLPQSEGWSCDPARQKRKLDYGLFPRDRRVHYVSEVCDGVAPVVLWWTVNQQIDRFQVFAYYDSKKVQSWNG